MRSHKSIGMAAALALCVTTSRAADLSTDDGLTLRLDDATGAVQALMVDGRRLPLLAGLRRGLSYREMRPLEKHAPKVLAQVDFDHGDTGWVKMTHKDWRQGRTAAAEVRDGGAAGSQCCARLGQERQYGHGVGFKELAPVQPGFLCEISWSARVPARDATFIVYLRLFDSEGRDVTEKTRPPKKWRFSRFSKTHFRCPIRAEKPDTWETLSLVYLVPERVRKLDIALCLWRGDYADADSLRLAAVGRGGGFDPKSPTGTLTPGVEGKTLRQQLSVSEDKTEIAIKYAAKSDHIWVEAEVRDTHRPTQPRALRMLYTLPIDAAGWWWHDDIRTRRRIDRSGSCQNSLTSAGHRVSVYPFSEIDDGRVGLALGVPMDWPRIESRSYSVEAGYRVAVDLGLSRLTTKIGPGRATFGFTLYRTDGEWGFRSAAARYYRIFPHLFTKRAKREGCWLFPVRPSEIPRPEDFGLTFWEGYSAKPEERACAREHGIYMLSYIRPRQVSQTFPGVKERELAPPHDEVLAMLKQLAADQTGRHRWNGGPRAETAQAVLNSLPQQADGRAPFGMSHYDIWAHVWLVNTDLDLPEPNCGRACKKYRIDPRLPHTDGIYVDNVFLAGHENYRESHLACADVPLSFGTETGRPTLLGAMSFYEFLAWLAHDLHSQGKLVQFNITERAYRFYAHLGDVLGEEVGSLAGGPRRLMEVESDTVCNLRRTLAYRKPTTSLLQEGNFHSPMPALTQAQVEQYLKHQTFYGFYPGIATAGGEDKPGYRGWKRYFRSPEQFERDRGLFRKYIPVIQRINRAGWEPVTYARTSDPKVFVERFGSWTKRDLHFTLRNQTPKPRQAAIRVMSAALGIPSADSGRVHISEVLSGAKLSPTASAAREFIAFDAAIQAFDTWVVSVGLPGGTRN